MAYVRATDFSLTLLSGNRVRMDVDFVVWVTGTEHRLGIPSRVAIKLMERDDARDEVHLYAEWGAESVRELGDRDDPASDWMFAGIYSVTSTGHFSRIIDRSRLPGGPGAEQWYCVLRAVPDIMTSISYSDELIADLA